jgi:hypothetical protein
LCSFTDTDDCAYQEMTNIIIVFILLILNFGYFSGF